MDLIPEGDVILDIGANIGITTVPLARKFKNSTIHSFEPIPNNITAMQRIINYYKLKNVVLHQIALGVEDSELKMVLPVLKNVKKQGLSHVFKDDDESDWNKGEIFTVPQKRLDGIEVIKNATKIAAIKIDVENFEYQVLLGAKELLIKHTPIIYCELWDNEVRPQVITYLSGLNYDVKVVVDNELVAFNGQSDNNFIFVNKAGQP